MGAETTAQRPTISRRQLFKYGASAGAAATVGPLLPAMTGVAHAGSSGGSERSNRFWPASLPIGW